MKYILCLFYITALILNTGAQWVVVDNNINYNIKSVSFLNYGSGFVAGYKRSDSSGVMLRTFNAGTNWSITLQQSEPIYSVYTPNESDIFAAGKSHVWVSSNAGSSWLDRYFENYELFDIRFQNSLSAYVCGYHSPDTRGCLVRSSDRGITWNFVFLLENTYKLFCIRFPTPLVGYTCGEHGTLRKVVEGVTNWNVINTGTTQNLNSMYFFDSETGFAAGENSTLIKTTNGGFPWFPVATGFTGIAFKSIQFYGQSTGYIVGDSGFIARTTNQGISWTQQTTPVTSSGLNGICFVNKDTLYAAGNAGTLLRTFNGGSPIGINPISNSIPSGFKIYQNFPNPFNPLTNIRFDIPKTSFVMLKVYDALGREIEKLVDKELNAGSYEYDWNASGYTSGIYFYRIDAGKFYDTKKMILIK